MDLKRVFYSFLFLFFLIFFQFSLIQKIFSFVDNFEDPNTISNIYTGDQDRPRERIGGSGNGKWNVWLQNWWNRGGYNPCSNPSYNQCPEHYGTNPGNARVVVENGKLQIFRAGDNCSRRAHRFITARTVSPYISTPNFELYLTTQLLDPQGWGVGWEIENIARGWYFRSVEDYVITFTGINEEFRVRANDQQWHTVRIRSNNGVRTAWVDGKLIGTGQSISQPTGYIVFGNASTQYDGWQGQCDFNDGMGPWPKLLVEDIMFYLGPRNGTISPNAGCSGPNTVVRFTTTFQDDDGVNDLKEVYLLLNNIVDANQSAFLAKYNLNENKFYLYRSDNTGTCPDVGGGWMDLGSPGLIHECSTQYATLKNSSTVLVTNTTTLTVYWDIVFLPGWTESVNSYLYAIDDNNLVSYWEKKGTYEIDGTAPINPVNIFPADGACLNERNPILKVASSDIGCGSSTIKYQFRLDFDEDHSQWNESRDWEDNTWETNFNLQNGNYYWQARAKDGLNNVSDWTQWWYFKIPCVPPPSQPTNLNETWEDCQFYQLSLPIFNWEYSHPAGLPQKGYQIKIYGENILEFTAETNSTAYIPPVYWVRENLHFGKSYSWQVRVKDEADNWSDWSEIKNFETRPHAYPWIDFETQPTKPTYGILVKFLDRSETFGGTTKSSWYWQFEGGNPTTSSLADPIVRFFSLFQKNVSLRVWDSDGFSCQRAKSIFIGLPLPWWKEIAPSI